MKPTTLQQQNACDWQAVISSVSGRRVLWRVLQAAQIDQHGFVPGDSCATAFHCGQKSIGLFLLHELEEVSPGIYAQMRAEYRAALQAAQQEIDRKNEELTHE